MLSAISIAFFCVSVGSYLKILSFTKLDKGIIFFLVEYAPNSSVSCPSKIKPNAGLAAFPSTILFLASSLLAICLSSPKIDNETYFFSGRWPSSVSIINPPFFLLLTLTCTLLLIEYPI